ncbi:MAG TPA: GDP-L-fucose synthase [Bacillota bacterium]|nr:GDP-L-fucose synthase [Bacillota bacterium]
MNRDAKIYIAGHTGLVGSSLLRKLQTAGFNNLVFRAHRELDLRNQPAVDDFFKAEKPEYIFLAAAKVGGIYANSTYPADFIYDNLAIETNLIHCAYRYGVRKLVFLGSSCIYPRLSPQPIQEEYLLTGELEKTNEAYAVAKIAGIKMCQAYNRQYGTRFISVMPTNLYGPNDNFDLKTAHVLPALIRKFHEAKIHHAPSVEIWGSGSPRREFLYIDDLADACLFLMENYPGNEIINIGTGEDISIKALGNLIGEIIGYTGEITWNTVMPDGTPQKRLDVSKINNLGWKYTTALEEGIQKTYQWFLTRC